MESPHCSPRCAVLQLALLLLLVMSTRDNWYEAYLTDLYGCAQFGAFNQQSCNDAMVRRSTTPTTPSAPTTHNTPTIPHHFLHPSHLTDVMSLDRRRYCSSLFALPDQYPRLDLLYYSTLNSFDIATSNPSV